MSSSVREPGLQLRRKRKRPSSDEEDLRKWLNEKERCTKKPRTEMAPRYSTNHSLHEARCVSNVRTVRRVDSAEGHYGPGASLYDAGPSASHEYTTPHLAPVVPNVRSRGANSPAATTSTAQKPMKRIPRGSFTRKLERSPPKRAFKRRGDHLPEGECAPRKVGKSDRLFPVPSSPWVVNRRASLTACTTTRTTATADSFRDVHGLRGLSQLEPENVVVHIHEREWDHFCRFLRSTYSCGDNEHLALFVSIINKVAMYVSSTTPQFRQWANDILAELSSPDCIPFWGSLSVLIRKVPCLPKQLHDFANDALRLARVLLQSEDKELFVPFLPLDELFSSSSSVQGSCPSEESKVFDELVSDAVEQRNSIRLAMKEKQVDESNSDINRAVALPRPAELMQDKISPTVQRNIVHGQYKSLQHYLQLHCNLLREDFIHPLRCALHKVQNEEEEEGKDVKVYKNVTLEGTDVTSAGLVYLVGFCLPRRKQVNWEHSKRLLFGALVCLSKDKFVTVTFATVANRKLESVRQGRIGLRFLDHQPKHGPPIDPKLHYKMIESPGYFEAFAPVISCLTNRAKRDDSLPFAKYLVTCDPDVLPPIYLRTKTGALMNMKGIACSCEAPAFNAPVEMDIDAKGELGDLCGLDTVQILNKEIWDVALESCNSMKLDESQMVALHTALVNEVALIQGPPGTGKTYIGIKLVEVLLRNKQIWRGGRRSPITVMCYTNHALDQFLHGILDIPSLKVDVYRVGGRSKSARISSLNVTNAMPRPRRRGWSPKMLPELQVKIQALLDLSRGTFNHMNQALYYLFLHPEWVFDHKEYSPLIEAMQLKSGSQKEVAKRMFSQLGINFHDQVAMEDQETIDDEDRNIYRPYQHNEDDRRILHETFKHYERDWMYNLVSTGELQQFVSSLQHIQSIVFAEQRPLRQDEMRGVLKQCFESLLDFYYEQHEKLSDKKDVHAREDDETMARILRDSDIVGFTTSGAAKYNQVLSKVKSKVLIVEEAAEVLEAHIIAAITKHNEHLVLIGDHKQLRPKTNDSYLGTQYGLEVSLFERLVNNGFQCATLAYQHRMRPEISELIHPHIYPNLKDHHSVQGLSDIKGMKHNMYFISHKHPETGNEDLRSPSNFHEASFLSSLYGYLLKQGYTSEEITVLTPYSGQVICLKNAFRELGIKGVRIVPVDHFQGEENDIILLSLVRSLKLGFVKVDNRVCVSLSRAKKGFYCIGNFSLFSKHSSLWKAIVSSVQEKGLIGESLPLQCQLHNCESLVSSSDDFAQVQDGGCNRNCSTRLKCGHMCPRKCHPDDPDHRRHYCEKPCTKLCTNRTHNCQAKCYQRCPPCDVLVNKTLPRCNHDMMVPCFVNPNEAQCQKPCPFSLPCGHDCDRKCSEPCTDRCQKLVKKVWPCGHKAQDSCYITEEQYMSRGRCKIPCTLVLSCGHPCSGTCGQCHQGRLHIPCKQKCKRTLLCGHPCKSEVCSDTCPPCRRKCPAQCIHGACGHHCDSHCIICQEPCEWKCFHYRCTKPCGEKCNRPVCDSPCSKLLKCKHPCLGLCGEPCPPVCRECDPDCKVFEVFLGHEDDPNARFIQLQDCECVVEVRDMDRYMDMSPTEGDTEVQWKRCPKCQCILTRSSTHRYGNHIKRIQSDMNGIRSRQRQILDPKTHQQVSTEVFKCAVENNVRRILNRFKNAREIAYLPHCFILKELVVLHAIADATSIHENLEKVWLHLSMFSGSTGVDTLIATCKFLQAQARSFSDFLEGHKCRSLQQLPSQVESDILTEQNRIRLLSKMYTLQAELIFRSHAYLKPEEECLIMEIKSEFDPSDGRIKNAMDQEKYSQLNAMLKKITESHPELTAVTEEERREIVTAMKGRKGSWYKCRNGHFYQIGECGGAMTTGRCIECGEAIGGSHHRLLEENAHAPEMDGSRFPAWGEEANMLNYQL